MSNPWTLTGPRIMLSSPEYLWERNGEINEGPAVIQKNDKMFLIYSASGCWTDDYSLGMLTMNALDDPLNASSWTKTDHPVFVTNSKLSLTGRVTMDFSCRPMERKFGMPIMPRQLQEGPATLPVQRVHKKSDGTQTERQIWFACNDRPPVDCAFGGN